MINSSILLFSINISIEVDITNLYLLTQVENEKLRKCDLIVNELASSY